MSDQTRLFTPPTPQHERVSTRAIRPWRSTGRNNVRKSIEALGNLTTIVLRRIDHPTYRYEVIDGARRLDALTEEGPVTIDAMVLPLSTRDDEARAATAALNLNRAPNPLEEARSFQDLLAAGHDTTTVATTLGISEHTIRARLRLLALPDNIARAVETRQVAPGVAANIAHLEPHQQQALSQLLTVKGKLTGEDVTNTRRAQREADLAALPAALLQAPTDHDPHADLLGAVRHAVTVARDAGLDDDQIRAALLDALRQDPQPPATATLSNPMGLAVSHG